MSYYSSLALWQLPRSLKASLGAPYSDFFGSDRLFELSIKMHYQKDFSKTIGRDAGVGATAQRGKLENDDLSDTSPPALAYLTGDTQPSGIAPCSHFSASSLASHYDQYFAPCVFMTHGSSTTKTNGRDAGVGATAQRGKLENDDLSDTCPTALAYLYQRTGTEQFIARH